MKHMPLASRSGRAAFLSAWRLAVLPIQTRVSAGLSLIASHSLSGWNRVRSLIAMYSYPVFLTFIFGGDSHVGSRIRRLCRAAETLGHRAASGNAVAGLDGDAQVAGGCAVTDVRLAGRDHTEYEMVSTTGVRIYIDVFYPTLFAAFECDGFVAHGENLTRDRFSFEKMRVRTIALQGFRYLPFSYDELDKKPEACCRAVYELLGRYGSPPGAKLFELSVNEREILRYAFARNGAFSLAEACACLQMRAAATRQVLYKLLDKQLLVSRSGSIRHHAYMVSEKARGLFL
jgi:hypothetical protein